LPTGEVLIQDELTGLPEASRVRWGMITPGKPAGSPGRLIELRQQRQEMRFEILAPSDPTWQTIDTAQPRRPWDSPNPGTQMVVFEASPNAAGELTLAVLATPGSCQRSSASGRNLRPLADWGR
jgi:hypothetical protein